MMGETAQRRFDDERHFDNLVWYRDSDFPAPVAGLVRAHIIECHVCQGDLRGEAVVSEVLRRVERPKAPAGLRFRIQTQIQTQIVAVGYGTGQRPPDSATMLG